MSESVKRKNSDRGRRSLRFGSRFGTLRFSLRRNRAAAEIKINQGGDDTTA